MRFITRIQSMFMMTAMAMCFMCVFLVGAVSAAPQLEVTLKLPAGEIAEKDMLWTVTFMTDENTSVVSTGVFLQKGNNSSTQSVDIAEDLRGKYVGFKVNNNNPLAPYLSKFYFNEAEPGNVSWKSCSMTKVELPTNGRVAIEMTVPVGRVIQGTVSLPSGEVSEGVTNIPVEAYTSQDNYDDWSQTNVWINNGESSSEYKVVIPVAPDAKTRISYVSWGPLGSSATQSYLSYGYYSESGTSQNYYDATYLDNTDHSGIDLTLLPGTRVFGTVSLPPGEVASGWGNSFHINMAFAESVFSGFSYASFSSSVQMHSGENSKQFAISVESGSPRAYTLWYDVYFSEDCTVNTLYGQGYYSSSGTTWDRNLASTIEAGSTDVTGKNMTVLEGKRISGELFYPAGMKNDSGYTEMGRVQVVSPDHPWLKATIEVYFEDKNNSADFCFIGPPATTDVKGFLAYTDIPYPLDERKIITVPGYYNASATTANFSDLTPLAGGQEHKNLRLTMLKGAHTSIKGTVMLPNKETAPAGGVEFDMEAAMNTPFDYWGPTPQITIDAGENFSSFEIPIKTTDKTVRWLVSARHYNWYDPCSEYTPSPFSYTSYYNGTCWVEKALPILYSDNITITILKTCDKLKMSLSSMMGAINAAVNSNKE